MFATARIVMLAAGYLHSAALASDRTVGRWDVLLPGPWRRAVEINTDESGKGGLSRICGGDGRMRGIANNGCDGGR
jgi:hypothetical protein